MARPLRIEYEGAFYHVTSRGNERRKIFYDKSDYRKFLIYLKEAKEKYNILLHGFVLMSNHYHLLIETPEANLCRAMHYLNGAYTNYFNIKRKRSGHLFQGRYKAIVVDQDNYLWELSRYIHLNPVRAGMVRNPEEYPYSSYRNYLSKEQNDLLTRELIWQMSGKNNNDAIIKYRAFVESEVEGDKKNLAKTIYGGIILGGPEFIKATLKKLETEEWDREEVSHRKELKIACESGEILEMVAEKCRVSVEDVRTGREAEIKKMAIYLLKKHTGMTNHTLGEQFGISYSAVTKTCQRLTKELEKNRALHARISQIERELSNVKG